MRLIDADALRESVLKWLPHDPCGVEENEHPYETDICVSMLMEIEDAPTIEPQRTGRWIPCSERLPEDEQNVLVTYKTTDKIHPCQYHDDGSRNPWYSYIDQCRAHMNVVLAWMPLPEPYAERGTDEKKNI